MVEVKERIKEVAEVLKGLAAKASAEKADVEIMDVGDVELVRIGQRDFIISMPAGKNIYFLEAAKGLMETKLEKLHEVA